MQRERAIELATRNFHLRFDKKILRPLTEKFERRVFNREAMQRVLPDPVFRNVVGAMEGENSIKPEYAEVIAAGLKDWAVGLGATHYGHWFQPLTGAAEENHDSFLEWNGRAV